MVRKDLNRAEIELRSLESELSRRLINDLAEVAAGRNPLFFFSEKHNPHKLPDHFIAEDTCALLKIAQKTIALRNVLAMPINQCPGGLFIAACNESANLDNPHRLGPKRLAARLLSQINELSKSAQ